MIPDSLIVLHPDWRHVAEFDEESGRGITVREYEAIDVFAQLVCRCSGGRVGVRYVDELDVRIPACMIVCEESVVDLLSDRWSLSVAGMMPRIFLLNVDRGAKTARRVASLRAAGALQGMRYLLWRTDPEYDPGGGVFGLKDIALEIGATWTSPGLWETDHYCLMFHNRYVSLPDLLSVYLVACGRRLFGK